MIFGRTNPENSARKLVVGLGNPGAEYEGTRHNLGFDVVDRLARVLDLSFTRPDRRVFSGKVKARIAEGHFPCVRSMTNEDGEGERQVVSMRPYLLVKPMTFMNASGVAVAAIARQFGVPPESIFVIYDDLNLPLGRLRLRPEGGPGGHNGMKSLLSCLGAEGFPRLRMGIGIPGVDPASLVDADFVLDGFENEDLPVLEACFDVAVDACRAWMGGTSLPDLMTKVNSFRALAESGD